MKHKKGRSMWLTGDCLAKKCLCDAEIKLIEGEELPFRQVQLIHDIEAERSAQGKVLKPSSGCIPGIIP